MLRIKLKNFPKKEILSAEQIQEMANKAHVKRCRKHYKDCEKVWLRKLGPKFFERNCIFMSKNLYQTNRFGPIETLPDYKKDVNKSRFFSRTKYR